MKEEKRGEETIREEQNKRGGMKESSRMRNIFN